MGKQFICSQLAVFLAEQHASTPLWYITKQLAAAGGPDNDDSLWQAAGTFKSSPAFCPGFEFENDTMRLGDLRLDPAYGSTSEMV